MLSIVDEAVIEKYTHRLLSSPDLTLAELLMIRLLARMSIAKAGVDTIIKTAKSSITTFVIFLHMVINAPSINCVHKQKAQSAQVPVSQQNH